MHFCLYVEKNRRDIWLKFEEKQQERVRRRSWVEEKQKIHLDWYKINRKLIVCVYYVEFRLIEVVFELLSV